jgi:DNA-directed RNA polymerase specialized sigma24 family protein
MKPNFVNYTYRDEMVADGLENCVAYINNFDPEKSTNPFAYFTQIIYYAFLRRIEHEKKHLYIKQKTLENFYFEGMLAEQAVGEDDRVVTVDLDNEYMKNLVESYEKKQAEKQTKAREKKLGVEKFISDGE